MGRSFLTVLTGLGASLGLVGDVDRLNAGFGLGPDPLAPPTPLLVGKVRCAVGVENEDESTGGVGFEVEPYVGAVGFAAAMACIGISKNERRI